MADSRESPMVTDGLATCTAKISTASAAVPGQAGRRWPDGRSGREPRGPARRTVGTAGPAGSAEVREARSGPRVDRPERGAPLEPAEPLPVTRTRPVRPPGRRVRVQGTRPGGGQRSGGV
ncbi:hypothetical protein GCM10011594_39510 [Nakamurella endophytica]|uniref:Uncharacterized protein n=1 Tax=Nakamurella endophytica TaxID=1748367 RepID=A0A917TCI5_9ACTN|nr:hypothetical protein GCM10011594_39510 [Nakamurella endophytica]